MTPFILCWSTIDHEDEWAVYDDEQAAFDAYHKLLGVKDTYSVTLAGVMKSSDYDVHPTFQETKA